MVQFREMVSDGRYETKPSIAPADDIVKQMNQKVDHKQSPASLVSTPFVQSKRPGAKKTSTTAASFFAKPPTTAKETSKKSKTTSTTNSKTNGKTVSKKPTPPPEKENVPTSPTENGKATKKMTVDPATVGNADDFVADEEESDDDEVEIVAATKKTKKKQPARAADPSPPPSPKRAAASPVRGAMDAFCSEQQTKDVDPTRQRKRRKRLVEKTFMENGYLRTETQAIWEDVPTDEEDAQAAKSAPIIATKKKPANTNNNNSNDNKSTKGQPMKQMGLMGFFGKK
jgi:hypothetical protein